MMPIHQLLNKIRWDPKENPEDYVLHIYDRVKDELFKIRYDDIEIEENLMRILIDGRYVQIPLHRIRKVACKHRIIWERP